MKYKLLILMIISFIVLSGSASATAWIIDNPEKSGLTTDQLHNAPTRFELNGTDYLIVGSRSEAFEGFEWDGNTWTSNSTIINGLPTTGTLVFYKPDVNYIDDNLNLIYGMANGTFEGYTWNGTGWAQNSTIFSGLTDIGDNSAPSVFEYQDTFYLISGEYLGGFTGYEWNGSSWISNATIVTGLSDIGYYSTPSVYNYSDTMYLISGEGFGPGGFTGFEWNGTSWNFDLDITDGLPYNTADLNYYYVTPEVYLVNITDSFQKPKLLSGNANGLWYAYELNPAPDLVSPTNNTIYNTTYPPLTYEVDFEWTDTGVPQYKIEVATDSNFNLISYYEITSSLTTTASFQNGTYYWRVSGFDLQEVAIGDPSDTYIFSVNATGVDTGTTTIDGIVFEKLTGINTPVDEALVSIYNNTWSSQLITSQNGYYQFPNLVAGETYSLQATKQGYVSSNIELVTTTLNETISKNILIERRSGAGDQYDFHYVKYTLKSITNTRYQNVDVEVFENGDLVPIYSGETGTDGSITFILNRDQEYRLEFTNATQGIDEEITHYPKNDEYNVYITTSLYPDDISKESDNIDITISKETINTTHAYLNVSYVDALNETSGLYFYVNQSDSTDPYNQTNIDSYNAGTTSNVTHSFIISPYSGQTFIVNINGDHTTYDSIDYSFSVRFEGMEDDHGFANVWIWLGVAGILFSGLLFKATKATQGSLIIVGISWVFVFLGWFDNLGDNGVLGIKAGLTLATVLSIVANMAKKRKED